MGSAVWSAIALAPPRYAMTMGYDAGLEGHGGVTRAAAINRFGPEMCSR